MSCDTEIGQEEFSSTWTPQEVEAMKLAATAAAAAAELEVVRMGNDRGWSRAYFEKMKKQAIEGALLKAHEEAHDRHFLRQVQERVAGVNVHVHVR